MTSPTKIGKYNVDLFPQQLVELHKEIEEHHKDLQMVMPGGMDLISTLNYLAGIVGIELDGNYLIADVAESIRLKLVARRLIVVNTPEVAEFLPPIAPLAPKE